ncbi:DNA-directed primase/polymerase protein-like [Diadema setosum]|uniref:DNA-directed primase/polymerase protein-like n=1 Tax=Diadema setosum TaxID=31175 RepID=UPI003B3BA122
MAGDFNSTNMSKDPIHQSDPSLFTRNQQRLLKQKQWQERLKKLEEKELWMKEHPIIPAYKPRLSGPAPLWMEFWRQKEAFNYTATHSQDVHAFAFEPENLGNGLRKFLVTSYNQLWHRIQALAQHNCHGSFYEIIQEGAACKLYFDLEFPRDSNPDLDGSAMVQTLIKFVIYQLRRVYNVHCHERHVINLDASTDSKFSCHLIFNIPGVAFQDTTHAGNFVHDICDRIHAACNSNSSSPLSAASASPRTDRVKISPTSTGVKEEEAADADTSAPPAKRKKGSGAGNCPDGEHRNESKGSDEISGDCARGCGERHDLHTLYINTMDGKRELFIDTAVYTRNRNFRLFKCVKLGKKNPLLVAPDNKYVVRMTAKEKSGTHRGDQFQFFLDSVITNVKFTVDTKILTCAGSKKKPSHSGSRRLTEMEEVADGDKSVSAQRVQSLHSLHLDHMPLKTSGAQFVFKDLLKHSRPGNANLNLSMRAFPPDRQLCVVNYLQHYIKRTSTLRGKERYLFISFKKPHHRVTSQTIARWIKSTLSAAGINTQVYAAHSTRAATTSAASGKFSLIYVLVSHDRFFYEYWGICACVSGSLSCQRNPFRNITHIIEIKLQTDETEILEGYHSSPLPDIDSFVRRHCISRGGVVGEIRRWTYFSQAHLLLFDISKNRWCENVGRQHRSNNIMIVVDLRHGVYYQKCHDPVCKEQNFKSEEKSVPPEFLPSFTEWDEEELMALADQVEQSCHGNGALHKENLGSQRVWMRGSSNGEQNCSTQRLPGGENLEILSDTEGNESLWDESITDDELMRSFCE